MFQKMEKYYQLRSQKSNSEPSVTSKARQPCAETELQQNNSSLTMEEKFDLIVSQLANLQGIPAQLNALEARLTNIEKKCINLDAVVKDMAESVDFLDKDLADTKKVVDTKVDFNTFDHLRTELEALEKSIVKKYEDLENRSRRNNLMFHGIPEGSEGTGHDACQTFIKEEILKGMLQISDVQSVEIQRAHRSPGGLPSDVHGKPRPIFVAFYKSTERDRILRVAPKILKTKLYRGKKLFISDDVSLSVREKRKELRLTFIKLFR